MGTLPAAYDRVLEILAEVGAQEVLDCPAGSGAFTRRLLDGGYGAQAGDIVPEQFRVPEVSCRRCDLNQRIPFEDSSLAGGDFSLAVPHGTVYPT